MHIKLILGKLLLAISLGLFVCTAPLFAQKKKKKKKEIEEAYELSEEFLQKDSIPNLELEMSEEEISLADDGNKRKTKRNKEKNKKKVYFGIKTKKGFTRRTSGSSIVLEVFRYIDNNYVLKDPYQQEIHYYDHRDRKIRTRNYYDFMALVKKGKPVYLLHGYYRVFRDKQIREEGFFYKGLKHGKWMEFDRHGVVLEKIKYHMGQTKESKIVYYDGTDHIKEIIPMVHGRIQGIYYKFYEDGIMAQSGKYANNKKVGMWREWYETRQRKRDINHPVQWWSEEEPTLLREWDTKGRLTYDIDRGGKINR